jgi:hypothetical protein
MRTTASRRNARYAPSPFSFTFGIGDFLTSSAVIVSPFPTIGCERTILGTEEFQSLLNRTFGQSRFDLLNWLILGGFVGLRPYEVLRPEWTGIQFQTREMRIGPAWTKPIESGNSSGGKCT